MSRKLPLLATLLLSCGPAEQPPADASQISASALVAYYRDNPRGTVYTDHRVQVRLDPRTYSVDGTTVQFFTGLPNTPPVVIFRCTDRIISEARPEHHHLILSGICRGPTRDGIRKADRIAFTIFIDDCRVTLMEQR